MRSMGFEFSIIPYQHLAKCPRVLSINVLLRVGELDIHVRVHTDQAAFVLGLTPF